jgi:hypothetical protein
MLTPAEFKTLYTEGELLTLRDTLKTQRTALLSGGTITAVNTRDLSVTYGVPATVDGVDSVLSAIAKALQMIDPATYGTNLLRVRRKYIL